MSTDAIKQALEQTLEMLTDNREYIEANERPEYLAMYDKAIAGAEKALAEQPAQQEPVAWMQDSIELYVQDRPSATYTIPLYTSPQAQPAQQDIPDLIAGALGVSRGTAYDLMREALAEQSAQSTADKSELETVPAKGGLLPAAQDVPEAGFGNMARQEPVTWGVDWGKAGDIPCVSIIKRLPDGGIKVLACEYAPYSYTNPQPPAQPEPFAFTDSYGNLWTKSAAQQLIDKSILLPLYVGKPEH